MKTKKIGKRLKLIRQQNGYSIKELSELLAHANMPIGYKTLYKWESNKITPDIHYLYTLSNIYSINVGFFFEEDETHHILNDTELKFITFLRKNIVFKRIICLLTQKDKEKYIYEHKPI